MTKLKSKKMTKSTFAVIIMAILMVAMLAFGGTYAYFTATTQKDTGSVKLGYVKLSDKNVLNTIEVNNIMPGEEILPAASYGTNKEEDTDNAGIILTVETTDKAGNYVAVRFDYKITLADGTTVLDATSVYGADGQGTATNCYKYLSTNAQTDAEKAQAAAYVALYDSLKADNIMDKDCQTNVGASKSTDVEYQWKSLDSSKSNVYFVVDKATKSKLQAVGATNLDEEDAGYNDYEGKIELKVNAEAFTLPNTIQDNWTEGNADNRSDLEIMEATIEISMTAASVQATAITEDDAKAELIKLLVPTV